MKTGSKHSSEVKARIAATLVSRPVGWRAGQGNGRAMSEETKAKIRAARLLNNPMKGRKHTEETRAKMRDANLPQWASGPDAINWKGGRTVDTHGYIQIYAPDHPSAVGNYVPEHRLIVEKRIGRHLRQNEEIHHDNEIRSDNRPENLIGPLTKGEHAALHRNKEIAEGKGSATSRRRRA